ncbi:MAG TPA: glycosyltransferase family 4 protein [Candidatus Omnitrophota bacterium]|nr:glycosyltransferase family 4 protein [Candidatus Omnitrophota bacterium]HPD84978.1 glycosyltransferase family 4 protein [Candidatus Omnitrophota bacterium]HRZ03836.1 glycosyltransferase family 4 protein [Candidatus Omnitrophota bacterium]
MNILVLANHLNTGGITSYLFTLAKGLKRIGHNVSVATSGGNRVEELEGLGFKHFTVDIRTKSEISPKIYLSLPRLNRFIREENIDILHTHTRVTQVAAAFLSRSSRRPFVTTCHGFFKPRLSRKMFPCWGQGIIAISEPVRKHLMNDFGVDGRKISLVHNGIDLADFPIVDDAEKLRMRREFGISQGPVIGIIARLSDVKGHSILISAMKKIISKIPSALLLIVGEGKMEGALKGQVNDLGLTEQIRFYPIVNKTAAMLSLMDVFVMPSLQEGLGLSVMEAQAMNLPVVGSRVGGIPSLIEENKTGILVSPGNVDELEQGIMRLLSDLPKAKELGRNARQFIERNFSAEEMAVKTADFYKRILKEYEENSRR